MKNPLCLIFGKGLHIGDYIGVVCEKHFFANNSQEGPPQILIPFVLHSWDPPGYSFMGPRVGQFFLGLPVFSHTVMCFRH